MKTSRPLYFWVFVFFLVWSCAEKQTQKGLSSLHLKYSQIQDISSIADCSSPFGRYTTEVHSFADGSCHFIQKFNPDEPPFKVRVTSTNQGYLLDEKNSIIDTLSQEDVEMIRGHEIHKMSIAPTHIFSTLLLEKNAHYNAKNHDLYKGKDRLGNSVTLFYNKDEALVSKIEFRNPKDTAQIIELFYDTWVPSDYGEMAKQIRIVQAQKDTFFFDFTSLVIRDKNGSDTII